ncbi:MAG TPA: PEP-CTERM sorting domain-containing protein [Lacunisphaera sp.]|nr:PEP-CTERM sorting domain-containing protein [Lacunisphaera sp.]
MKILLRNTLVPALLLALAFGQAHGQATMYGVGDLAGGASWSQVRDVTKTGGVIYAVGSGSANSGSTSGDTAFLWTSSGGLSAIPNLATNTQTNFVTASDITPDAAYIASRSHYDSSPDRQAVQVTTSSLTPLALASPGGFSTPSYAVSISNDGSVLYGVAGNGSGQSQAVRFVAGGSATAIPFASVGDTWSSPVARAISSNGNLMLGTSSSNSLISGAGSRAFLYNNTAASITLLPLLSGGSWSQGLAMNSAGSLMLLGGDTPTNANGELYLYDGSTVAALGTPDPSLGLNIFGGMSADGSVVGLTWTGASSNQSFIYNSHGWQDFYGVASGSGANLSGWTTLNINGISEDGTLVWGDGLHNGNNEGFVMEFSSGYLSAVPEPSTYAAIAGAASLAIAGWRRRRSAPV